MIYHAKELENFISQIQDEIGTIDVKDSVKQSINQNYVTQSDLSFFKRAVPLVVELADVGTWVKTIG